MHGHISYVTQKLSEIVAAPRSDEMQASLRSMRTMLINGLEASADHRERANRLLLVRKIDRYLTGDPLYV